MLQYPLNLHCSQTAAAVARSRSGLQYPLNLHCSQTQATTQTPSWRLQYPLNLHCSQTAVDSLALKDCASIPSEFTLLSNLMAKGSSPITASIPSEFTLLSNFGRVNFFYFWLQYPLNLHCSQTKAKQLCQHGRLQYPLNLHCSQTRFCVSAVYVCFNTL